MPGSPFAKAVIMSVPLSAAFRPFGRVPQAGRLAAKLPRQLLLSWYILYFQLPWLPDRSASWVIPRLWRKWSPRHRADEDLRYVDDAIGAPERWRAALGFYRATIRGSRPPWIERVLPDESEIALIADGGHFLQLDQPDLVARHIVDFVGRP